MSASTDRDKNPVVVPSRGSGLRFLGLTKTGFFAVITASILVGTVLLAVFLAYQVGQNHKQVSENRRALTLLCDRGHIMDGLVLASISATQLQLVDDIAGKRTNAVAADRAFLASFAVYHQELQAQFTNMNSPCAALPPSYR